MIPLALWARFRAAAGEERQQLKWILAGAVVVIAWLIFWIPQPDGATLRAVQSLLPGLALTSLATGFGLALFKYRLWDVDIVIRRSLVYGILWLGIAAVYVGVAAGFGLIAGSRFPVEIAIAITVIATVVFQPARSRLEGVADRLVFGHRESPVAAMQTLGSSIAVESRPRDIADELADITRRVLHARAVEVEIEGTERAVAGEWGDGEATTLPLSWGAETLGLIRCLPRRAERFDPDDLAVVEALATQAALTVSRARLASRMVTAEEAERRRIERDIHDGVQQDLATQIGQIALARSHATDDPVLSERLTRIQEEMQRTLVEIRNLAQGIHPSVLRDGGLLAAVEDRCSRLPIDVLIEAGPEMHQARYSNDLEAAVYFTVTEAVANVVKHADATSISIQLAGDDGRLAVAVTDDGRGFDADRLPTGSGISGLSDRLQALGGELAIESSPGGGTSVRAWLPLPRTQEAM